MVTFAPRAPGALPWRGPRVPWGMADPGPGPEPRGDVETTGLGSTRASRCDDWSVPWATAARTPTSVCDKRMRRVERAHPSRRPSGPTPTLVLPLRPPASARDGDPCPHRMAGERPRPATPKKPGHQHGGAAAPWRGPVWSGALSRASDENLEQVVGARAAVETPAGCSPVRVGRLAGRRGSVWPRLAEAPPPGPEPPPPSPPGPGRPALPGPEAQQVGRARARGRLPMTGLPLLLEQNNYSLHGGQRATWAVSCKPVFKSTTLIRGGERSTAGLGRGAPSPDLQTGPHASGPA